MTGILNALIAGVSGAVKDTYFNLVSLLLPGNGTNGAQNNTFLDSSSNNFTITRNGATTQGAFSPFSQTGWGGAFNTSTTYLTVTDTANLRFGSSNFTIEAWVYRNASGATQTIASKGASTPTGWVFQISSADKLVFTDTSTSITGATSIAANTWTYVAVVRAGTGTNQTTLYVNGTSDGTGTSATNFNQTSNMLIGADRSTTNFANGYISNLRLSNTNRTISSTPKTALTADANTIFLSLNLNRFQYTDSTAAYTDISATGTPSVVAFSPFAPTAAYTTAAVGGSGYFDGTGDYLTVASNAALQFPTQDFTIEAWVYLTSLPSSGLTYRILQKGKGVSNDLEYLFEIENNSGAMRLLLRTSADGITATTASGSTIPLVVNTWCHVAVTRTTSTASFWFNGAAAGTGTVNSNIYTGSADVGLFANNVGLQPLVGYASNTRVVKGTAVYTGAFTPPTAPITNAGSTSAASYPSTTNVNTSFASSATSLLVNFTNAGITDATAKNDLETVGNAQISTTQSKWGGSSMSFDGNGDYLFTPSSVDFVFNGDFTIEFWVYRAGSSAGGTGNYESLVATYNGSTGYGVWWLNTTNVLHTRVEGTTADTTTALSNSTWYHVAVTRSGSTVRTFVNGVQGSSFTSSATAANPGLYIGAQTVNKNFNGYIQDLRITKGYARYTANFTPPTAAFPTL